jgi:hypothetical protein
MNTQENMAVFIKSMSNPDRLRVIGLLAQGPLTLTGISTILDLAPVALAHHLDLLTSSGVARNQDGLFELDDAFLEQFSRQQLQAPKKVFTLPEYLSEADGRIIRNLARLDGSLKRLPGQLKQWMAVLRYILPVFDPDTNYTEKQVNSLLMKFHADTAALRRYLVDAGMLQRERDGSRYWREVSHD